MPAKAPSSPTYTWRLAALCLLCLGFGGYFLYDGYVRYPFEKQVFDTFVDQFERPGKSTEEWNGYARQHRYPLITEGERPGKPHSEGDIRTQKLIGSLIIPVGLVFGLWFVRYRGRWIASDGEGLITSWGERVPFASVRSLNKELWKKKGIAVVHYADPGNAPGGSERRLILDDWKYERHATTTMVQEIESRLPAEKVIGNPPAGSGGGAAQAGGDAQPRDPSAA